MRAGATGKTAMTDTSVLLADDEKLSKYSRAVARQHELEKEASRTLGLTLYDTFDWRLYRKGLFAFSHGDSFAVGASLDRPPLLHCDFRGAPRFWWDFEGGEARAFLEGISGVRALLPLATIDLVSEDLNVRNADGKIVCRISFLACPPGPTPGRSYLLIKPLRGYEREGGRLRALAVKSGMKLLETPLLEDLLLLHGRHPGDYSSKLDLHLDRDMTISEAALAINTHLLSTIRSNVQGVIEDLDTEFLHDFRVATRRTRSCLTQLRGALPSDRAAEYSAEFGSVARRCNVLRDLDVCLLGRQGYYDLLPKHLHGGLDRYFSYIKRRRGREFRSFSSSLQTDAFGALLDGWEAFLQDPGSRLSSEAAVRVADARIYDRYQKILKRGRKITVGSPDAYLHRLRIECKKLRYLLEFFQSYYPARKMSFLIGHLKEFQDNLGEFNDLTVQQADLTRYMQTAKGTPAQGAAIGGLLTAFHGRQVAVREDFHRRFEAFDSRENRALYGKLFGGGR